MNREFYSIYEQLFEIYGHYPVPMWWPERWPERMPITFRADEILRRIKSSVDRGVERANLSNRLRPDARLFLLVNFHQLFLLPLYYVRGWSGEYEEYVNAVDPDIDLILKEADKSARKAGYEEKPEITGRHILDAVHNLWKELRLNRFEIWG